jgi:hypothetical protein
LKHRKAKQPRHIAQPFVKLVVMLIGAGLISGCLSDETPFVRASRTAGELGLSPGSKRAHSLPLNNPQTVSAANASHMRPDDLVVGLVVGGQARAYPWWVMVHYHVVNDTIEVENDSEAASTGHVHNPHGVSSSVSAYVPLLLTLCEACSGVSAFIPSVTERPDHPLVFSQCRAEGAAPHAYKAIGVYTICDLQTQSRWHPFSGRAGSGPLEGARLERLPVFHETWSEWRKRHPNTVVLAGGRELRSRPHGQSSIATPGVHPTYSKAVALAGFEDDRLERHAMVLGVGAPDRHDAVAVPLDVLQRAGGVAQLQVGGESYVLVASGEYRAMAYLSRLDGQPISFLSAGEAPFVMIDGSGSRWNDAGLALSGPNEGKRIAPAADSYLVEWSDWIMEHPTTRVIDALP